MNFIRETEAQRTECPSQTNTASKCQVLGPEARPFLLRREPLQE